jgi:Protein of unknown function (DUF3551)
MRRALLILTVCCAASTSAALSAVARDFPFCIRGCDFGGSHGDCSFTSYQQCQATASGREAWCDANPYYSAGAELRPHRSRHPRRGS